MLVDKALELAAQGMYLYPVNIIGGKKIPVTKHGFKDATTDTNQLKEWFTNADTEIIGIGLNLRKSKLVCLDIDNHDNERQGYKDAKKLISLHPDFNLDNADYIEKTAHNGLHLIYRANDSAIKKVNITEHIELLVDSTVITPTKGYKLIKGSLNKDIKQVPDWLLTPIKKPNYKVPAGTTVIYGRKKTIGQALDALYKPVPVGERHNSLVSFACSFMSTGADIDTIERLVYKAGETMGLDNEEIANIWNWAVDTALNQLKEKRDN